MCKSNLLVLFVILQCLLESHANLEGPFLFWGPKQLETYKRPAMKVLEQDDLVDIYANQAAIVVFNNQDALPLTGDNFPRLRKLMERKTMLVLYQDFLDVHPEYINNETQVISVQGPNSERDAEITETFERLEDIYGEGRVLGVLGNSGRQEDSQELDDEDEDVLDDSTARKRRQTEEREDRDDRDNGSEAPEDVVYNATGKILLYSSDCPILRYASGINGTAGEVYRLKSITSVNSDDREQFSRLIVTFKTANSKVTLRFRFPDSPDGSWSLGPVELLDGRGRELLLTPRPMDAYLGAPRGFSFSCSLPVVFENGSVTLTFDEIQVQPQLNGANSFGMAYNCIGFTTVPIWSGIMVSFLLIFGVSVAIIMITDIKTMDRFENSKGKTLTISVNE